MNDTKIRLQAKRVIEERMGLKVSNTDIVLLEASETEGFVTDILFYRLGYNNLHYSARYVDYKKAWELTIINMRTHEEMGV